jgi:hypothetical protein
MISKFLVPIVFIFVAFLLSRYLTYRCTVTLDFSQVFKSSIQQPPQLMIPINGVEGDKAIIGFNFPNSTSSSEELTVTEKNLDEIRSSLNNIETQQWQIVTNLPSTILRFNATLYSSLSSPNNAKKISYFLITDSDGVEYKILPGENRQLINNISISNLPEGFSKLKIKMIYENRLYQVFLDKNGQLVSQATGKLVLRPTGITQLWIFFVSWAFIAVLFSLLKQTALLSKDFKEALSFFRGE